MAQVAAPGVNILSAKLGGGLRSLSSTSMACPHVAGVAALWWGSLRQSGTVRAATNLVVANLLTHAGTGCVAGQRYAQRPWHGHRHRALMRADTRDELA
jgi:hypothetical protein